MSTLVSFLTRSKRIEAWITMGIYIVLQVVAVFSAWLSAAPEHWSEITWKSRAMLAATVVGAVAGAIKSTMSKSWHSGQVVDFTTPPTEGGTK